MNSTAGDPIVLETASRFLSGEAPHGKRARGDARQEKFWWDVFANVRGLSPSRRAAAEAIAGAVRAELDVGQAAVNALLGPAFMSLVLIGMLHRTEEIIGEVLQRYPGSVRARINLSKARFWSGNLAGARHELATLRSVDNRVLENPQFIQCALAYRAWDLLSEIHGLQTTARSNGVGENTLHPGLKSLLALERETNIIQEAPVICINLDRDVHRFEGMCASYGEIGLRLERFPGIFGASVPGPSKKGVLPPNSPYNMIGCCLSHLAIWERVANSNDEIAVVLEDDALPLFDFNLSTFLDALPKGTDLCFLNDRIIPGWADEVHGINATISLSKAWTLLPESTRAVGADGYVLSRSGALKLLELVEQSGISSNLDWFLCASGLSESDLASGGRANAIIGRAHNKMQNWPTLDTRVASVPLIAHRPLGFTARHHFTAR